MFDVPLLSNKAHCFKVKSIKKIYNALDVKFGIALHSTCDVCNDYALTTENQHQIPSFC